MSWMKWVHDDGGVSWRNGCCFDPVTLMTVSVAATAASGAVGAASTLAGGLMADSAGRAQAKALNEQGNQAQAAGQRKMLDDRLQTKLIVSKNIANAAASGVAADTGSPLENTTQIAQRGEYHALMDLWNGENEATSLRNQGKLAAWKGRAQMWNSVLGAAGTLAGSAGSMAQKYGAYNYPTQFGRAGVGGL